MWLLWVLGCAGDGRPDVGPLAYWHDRQTCLELDDWSLCPTAMPWRDAASRCENARLGPLVQSTDIDADLTLHTDHYLGDAWWVGDSECLAYTAEGVVSFSCDTQLPYVCDLGG